MKRLAVFYHIWSPANTDVWKLLVDEQLKLIQHCGLHEQADIACCISGPQHAAIREFVRHVSWLEVIEHTEDESEFEGLTLKHAYQRCLDDRERRMQAVAYLHTKGIRHLASNHDGYRPMQNVNSWRHLLEYGVLKCWRDCVIQLMTNDLAGINYHEIPARHFGGNFWWAAPDYLRRLPHPVSPDFASPQFADPQNRERIRYEMWVGSGQPQSLRYRRRGRIRPRSLQQRHLPVHQKITALTAKRPRRPGVGRAVQARPSPGKTGGVPRFHQGAIPGRPAQRGGIIDLIPIMMLPIRLGSPHGADAFRQLDLVDPAAAPPAKVMINTPAFNAGVVFSIGEGMYRCAVDHGSPNDDLTAGIVIGCVQTKPMGVMNTLRLFRSHNGLYMPLNVKIGLGAAQESTPE